jgi:CRP-like cAMP-binding protein
VHVHEQMRRPDSFEPQTQPAFPSSHDGERACEPTGPRRNRLLAALPPAEFARLLPDLEPVALPRGWTVHAAGDRESCLYFLTEGLVSRFQKTTRGAAAEFAITGREGLIGVASFLGGESTPSQAVVLSAGYAYRLKEDGLNKELARHGQLLHLLLRYTRALMVQAGQTAACNRHHSLLQQLGRWLLLALDRSPTLELAVTHEFIASMLGVRRESVTLAAGKLQKAGAISCQRRHIAVLDRARLESVSCECYRVIKWEYDRLSPAS